MEVSKKVPGVSYIMPGTIAIVEKRKGKAMANTTLKIDIASAKTIRTQPVHQWDTLVSLRFPDTLIDADYKVHFDEPDGTGTIVDISLHSAIIPNDLLGNNFDGDIHAHLVWYPTLLQEVTVCDIVIPVIPRQKGEGNR